MVISSRYEHCPSELRSVSQFLLHLLGEDNGADEEAGVAVAVTGMGARGDGLVIQKLVPRTLR